MHVSEYLCVAADRCSSDSSGGLSQQRQRLKDNQALSCLMPHIEAPEVDEAQAPVRKAYRYLRNRLDQLDDRDATEKELPIGSGEIESAQGYVAQARLGSCVRVLVGAQKHWQHARTSALPCQSTMGCYWHVNDRKAA